MWEERWILRCRGVPFKITKPEIAAWFDTSQLWGPVEDSVHITYNAEGRPSGDCYVIVADEDSYYNGLGKNKQYMESRYVEIYESDEGHLARALKKGAVNKRPYGGTDTPIVKIRGIPFSATEDEVKEFFAGLSVTEIRFREVDGRKTGEAYVKFSRQDEATAALEKHMQSMGNRYIEIFKANNREMECQKPLSNITTKKPPGTRQLSAYKGGLNEHKVFMKGLPFQASQGDIIKFFYPIMPKHIELILGQDGRSSGTAYAFFNTHEDALQVMDKDQSYMESRYIELYLESEPGETGVGQREAAQKAAELIAQAHGKVAQSHTPAVDTSAYQSSDYSGYVGYPTAVANNYSAVSTDYSAVSNNYSAVSNNYSAVSNNYSAVSNNYSTVSKDYTSAGYDSASYPSHYPTDVTNNSYSTYDGQNHSYHGYNDYTGNHQTSYSYSAAHQGVPHYSTGCASGGHGVAPPPPDYEEPPPPPPPPAEIKPVRKSLMAGAVRPIGQENEYPSPKRGKPNMGRGSQGRGAGRGVSGGRGATRGVSGGRGATRGVVGGGGATRGAPPAVHRARQLPADFTIQTDYNTGYEEDNGIA